MRRLLELGHTITVSYEVYRTTILLYGTTRADLPHPALGVVIVFGTYIATLTQVRGPLSNSYIPTPHI